MVEYAVTWRSNQTGKVTRTRTSNLDKIRESGTIIRVQEVSPHTGKPTRVVQEHKEAETLESLPPYDETPEEVQYLGLEKEYQEAEPPVPINVPIVGGRRFVYNPFQQKVEQRFQELSPRERFEYGIRFTELKDEPVSKWREYEGGVEYLLSLPPDVREQKLSEYQETEEFQTYLSSPRGEEQVKDVAMSMAREGLGPFDLVTMEAVPREKVYKRLARQRLFTASDEFEKVHWESLDLWTRGQRLIKEGIVGAGLAIPSLAEQGLSLGFGTPTPLSEWQQERFVSYTPSLIEAGIGEGAEFLGFGKSSSGEIIAEDPMRGFEAGLKTAAEFIGFKVGYGITSRGVMQVRRLTTPFIKQFRLEFGKTSFMKNVKGFVQEQGIMKTPRYEYRPWQYISDKPSSTINIVPSKIKTMITGYKYPQMRGTMFKISRADILTTRTLGRTPPRFFEYKYYWDYTQPRIESYIDQVKIQNQLKLRKDLLKMKNIETEFFQTVNPLKINESTFILKQYGKQRWAAGEIIGKGNIAEIKGKTYYKLSPEDVFYQTKSFKSIVKTEPIGEWGDIQASFYQGRTATFNKRIFLPDRKGMMFKPDITTSLGTTYSQTRYAGETYIKGGFLEQYKTNLTKVISEGVFRDVGSGGRIRSWGKIFRSELKGKDYFGSDMGFDTSGLSESLIKTDLFIPPFTGLEVSLKKISYPKLFEPLTKGKMSLSELEFLESGITGSSYWAGTVPVTSMITKSTIALGTLSSNLTKTLQNIKLDKKLKQQKINMQTQLTTPTIKTAQVSFTAQTQTPITKQTLIQQQKQIQNQMQMMNLITQTTTPTVSIPPIPQVKISTFKTYPSVPPTPTPISPIPIKPIKRIKITPFLPSGDGGAVQQIKPGQAYEVWVKDRYIVHGKKRHQERLVRLTKQKLTKNAALSLGATAIDNSAARSFTIKPVTGKPDKPRIPTTSFGVLQNKFYKRNKLFIERTDYAIDTSGEIREISARGWIAERKKLYPKTKKVVNRTRVMKTHNINKDIKKIFGGMVFDF